MRIIKEESLIRKADIAQSPFQRDSRKHMFPNSNLFSSNHHCIALIYVTLYKLALLMLISALMLILMLTPMFILLFHIHILRIESSHTIMPRSDVALTKLIIWEIKSLGLWLPCDVMF